MTYRLPGVEVSQILTRASQALGDSQLLPCFIGSLNQVVRNAPINLTFPLSSPTVIFPNLMLGATVNDSSIAIQVANAMIQVGSGAVAGAALVAGGNTIQGGTGVFLNVQIGDTIIFNTATHGQFTVASKLNSAGFLVPAIDATGTYVTTNETISYPAAIADPFTIQRNVGTVNSTIVGATYTATSISFTSLTYNTYPIIGGNASITYVALRSDLNNTFYEVTDLDQLAIDMSVDILNPLGFYLGEIAPSANGGVNNVLAFILPNELDASYIAALTNLGIRKDPYLLVPLSNDSTVNNAYAAHVEAMSQPDPSYFRAALLSPSIASGFTTTVLASGTLTK